VPDLRTDPDARASLDARYGRTPGATRRTRVVVISAAVAFVAVFAAWLWWGGILQPTAQLEVRDTGHVIESDRSVSVDWSLTVSPGTAVSCAVQAQDERFGIVGWKVVDVPPSDQRTRALSEQLLTSELAVTGLIYECWLS